MKSTRAYTSHKVRHKVAQEKGQKLNDLGTTFLELKAAGYSRVADPISPYCAGEEWEKKIVEVSREIPGLKVALGKPLLNSKQDQERTLRTVAQTFPKDLKDTAVVLMAHGSPAPKGEKAYLAFGRLLAGSLPKMSFWVPWKANPPMKEAFEAVKKSNVRCR